MSVRIHKAMGYGTDAFKPTSQFKGRYEEISENWDYQAFLDFAKEHFLDVCKIASEVKPSGECDTSRGSIMAYRLCILAPLAEEAAVSFHHIVVWQTEKSRSRRRVVLIPPSASARWYRFDDDIDYAEARNARDRLAKLDRGIYPYDRGNPPYILAAMCLYLGVPELFTQLKEVIYTYWC